MVILKILRAGPASQWINQTVQAPWCAPVLPVRVDRKPDSHTRRDVGRTGRRGDVASIRTNRSCRTGDQSKSACVFLSRYQRYRTYRISQSPIYRLKIKRNKRTKSCRYKCLIPNIGTFGTFGTATTSDETDR